MKKLLKILIIIVIVLIVLWLITFGIDYYRCSHWQEPIFVIEGISEDMAYSDGRKTSSYYCLGYNVSITKYPELNNQLTYVSMSIFNKRILEKKRDVSEITNNMFKTEQAVIVEVQESSLLAMLTSVNYLYTINFSEEGNIGFKEGQEILIYYDGVPSEKFDIQTGRSQYILANVGKIEIIKEESNIQIPEDILRNQYSSKKNVLINIKNLTLTGMSIEIIDKNEYKYKYESDYTICQKNNDKPNNNIIVEGNSMSIAGYDPWPQLQTISSISSESTVVTTKIDENTMHKEYDWSNLYGKLGVGEYNIYLSSSGITINFTVNDNFEIVDSKISL